MTLITSNLHEALDKHLTEYPRPTRVDLISSYIREEGLNALKPFFNRLVEQGTHIRILTTLQRKITDVKSLDYLARLPMTSVYVFWPMQPNFHSKGWLFLYGKDNVDSTSNTSLEYHPTPQDTVILGSSNITQNGVRVAVDWNVLLRRKTLDSDASSVIDEFRTTFSNYVESQRFRVSFMRWRVDAPDFSQTRTAVQNLLLTDEDLLKKAATEGWEEMWFKEKKERWEKLKAEQDEIRIALKRSIGVPNSSMDSDLMMLLATASDPHYQSDCVESNAQDATISDIDRSMMAAAVIGAERLTKFGDKLVWDEIRDYTRRKAAEIAPSFPDKEEDKNDVKKTRGDWHEEQLLAMFR